MYSPDGVRLDRSGWRDQEISERHREWGFNCPAVDLDFLVVEYNKGLPVCLIEYKHFKAQQPTLNHATYRALSDLANNYKTEGLPLMVAFYWPKIWAFKIIPVNNCAKKHFTDGELLSEYDFVKRLYLLRRLTLADSLRDKLNKLLPSNP